MKYKVGDRVVINDITKAIKMFDDVDKLKFIGKIMTITSAYNTFYEMKEDNIGCLWNDIDIKCLAENEPNMRPKVDHYTRGNIECIDYIMDKNLNFNLGNVIKYVTRAGFKDDKLEDLGKAKDYLNFEIERIKE